MALEYRNRKGYSMEMSLEREFGKIVEEMGQAVILVRVEAIPGVKDRLRVVMDDDGTLIGVLDVDVTRGGVVFRHGLSESMPGSGVFDGVFFDDPDEMMEHVQVFIKWMESQL